MLLNAINPTRLRFCASVDHGKTLDDGTPLVRGYRLDTVGYPAWDLGLPAPDEDGVIEVEMPLTTGGPYISQVVAYNDTGETASHPTNVYGFLD